MTTQTFKAIATKLIKEAGKPLHYREITSMAIEKGLLKSDGKTPWATMNAQLSMDIVNNGESSKFYRAEPGHFGLRELGEVTTTTITKSMTYVVAKHKVTDSLNTKQKATSQKQELLNY